MANDAGYTNFLDLEYRLTVTSDDRVPFRTRQGTMDGDELTYLPAAAGLQELDNIVKKLILGVAEAQKFGTEIAIEQSGSSIHLYVYSNGDQSALYNDLSHLFKEAGTPFYIKGTRWAREIADRVLQLDFGKTTNRKKGVNVSARSFFGIPLRHGKGMVLQLASQK